MTEAGNKCGRGAVRVWAVAIATLLFGGTVRGGQTWYVADTGNDTNTGTNWAQAWATISNAVANAVSNDVILVSNGTYTVTAAIIVDKAVTISGYPANTNTIVTRTGAVNHRLFNIAHASAVVEFLTLTNGTGGSGGAVVMSGGTLRNCLIERNTSAVWGYGGALNLSGNSMVSNCVLRYNKSGAGSFGNCMALYATARVVDCLVADNSGNAEGGGIYMTGGTVERCVFTNNAAAPGGGVSMYGGTVCGSFFGAGNAVSGWNNGGGAYVAGGVFSNNVVYGGSAKYGAGVYITAGLVVGCTITNVKPASWATYLGAGLYMSGGSVRNTLIARNELPDISQDGAGVAMSGGSLVSCTVAANRNTGVSTTAGGTRSGGGIYWMGGGITNCIIYSNTTAKVGDDDDLAGAGVTQACWYCCSPSLTNSENSNITGDPLFAGGGDYHLQSKAGRWTPSGWVQDAQQSPCIDKGPPTWDWSQEPEPNGKRINMGAYGGTIYASKTQLPRGTVLYIR